MALSVLGVMGGAAPAALAGCAVLELTIAKKAAVPGLGGGKLTEPFTRGVRPVPGVRPVLGVRPVRGVRPVLKGSYCWGPASIAGDRGPDLSELRVPLGNQDA